MLLDRDTARLLGKIAFLGLWQGRFKESDAIFKALEANDPSRIGPLLGQGMVLAHQGKHGEASAFFKERALALDPEDEHARVWYALSLLKGGKEADATPLLKELAATAKGNDVAELARQLLSAG
jgi:Putative Zn-dependent protease, contains TPR repeats